MKFLGIERAPRFSPHSEEKDRNIFQAVAAELSRLGHDVLTIGEDEYTSAERADGIFSMARSEKVLNLLAEQERSGVAVVNSAQALLTASRLQLTERFSEAGIPIPATWRLQCAAAARYPLWMKRGDACAQSETDVCFLKNAEELKQALQRLPHDSVADTLLCEHVEGDLVKFYGVGGADFFHAYYPTAAGNFGKFGLERINGLPRRHPYSLEALKRCADRAARLSGITVYGGDAIIKSDGSFVLIDFNDWPSFSVCVATAATAIAQAVERAASSH